MAPRKADGDDHKPMPMTLDDLRKQRRDIVRLAEAHGAASVRVFGSVARGDATEASDVDFLVNMAADRSILDLGALLVDVQQLLGRPVDVSTERGLRARIRDHVLGETVPL